MVRLGAAYEYSGRVLRTRRAPECGVTRTLFQSKSQEQDSEVEYDELVVDRNKLKSSS
jgi:hypothetical protein